MAKRGGVNLVFVPMDELESATRKDKAETSLVSRDMMEIRYIHQENVVNESVSSHSSPPVEEESSETDFINNKRPLEQWSDSVNNLSVIRQGEFIPTENKDRDGTERENSKEVEENSFERISTGQTNRKISNIISSNSSSCLPDFIGQDTSESSTRNQSNFLAALAQMENSAKRMEGVTNLSFLALDSRLLDSLLNLLYKLSIPCFCFQLQGNRLCSLSSFIVLFAEDITQIYLQNNNFEVFPRILLKLNKLKVLDISRNKLKALPNDIGQLKNLIVFDVAENDLKELPQVFEEIVQLEQLRVLNTSGNVSLTLFPKQIEFLHSLNN